MSIKKVTVTVERVSAVEASVDVTSQNMRNIDLLMAATAIINKVSQDSGHSTVGLTECIMEYFKTAREREAQT